MGTKSCRESNFMIECIHLLSFRIYAYVGNSKSTEIPTFLLQRLNIISF